MTERDGRIVPAASARAAAWAIYGVSREQPSSAHVRLTVPTLLIRAASNDDADALERFRAAVPHARVETLDTGHDVPEDAPADTAELVAAFLESTLP
jgi:pimeloyl-ACP methyl ester carboxylesterase